MARQERAIRTRRAILIAAAEVFDEVGYEAATISAVLERSGVTKGALYFHFTSKQELAQAVLAGQVEAMPPTPQHELTLQEVVDQALLLSYMLTFDPMVRGSVRLTVEPGSPADGLDRRVPMQAWTEYTLSFFKKAEANGELLPHVDLETLSKLSVGAFTGVQVLSKIMTDREDITQRIADLYTNLLTAVAVPAVLVQLDFSPGRGEQTYRAALRPRREVGDDAGTQAE